MNDNAIVLTRERVATRTDRRETGAEAVVLWALVQVICLGEY
jgi:hypothetical protein